MHLLEVEKLNKNFGNLPAIYNLDFKVDEGEIFGIAGPNGAGKTTLFNIITNIPYPPTSGSIFFEGKRIEGRHPHQICRMGIARTFQIPEIISSETTFRNVIIGKCFGLGGVKPSLFRFSESDFQASLEALDQVGLREKKDVIAGNLSLFDKKRLMMASALVTRPRVIMLDEPVAGLNPVESRQIIEIIRRINKEGITVIMIEHIMKVLMGLSHRIMILNYGEKIAEGIPEEVVKNPDVIKSYLGQQ